MKVIEFLDENFYVGMYFLGIIILMFVLLFNEQGVQEVEKKQIELEILKTKVKKLELETLKIKEKNGQGRKAIHRGN